MIDKSLSLILLVIILLVFILLGVLAYIYYKDKIDQNKSEQSSNSNPKDKEKVDHKSVFRFMEFDEIEDNMIVQDNGTRFLMVVECKGINYDLLSGVEKTSIEEGFMQFLNTLKSEIQLYVQTRKVNLSKSTQKYRERLEKIRLEVELEEQKYLNMQRNPNVSKEEMLKEIKELTKKRNLYDYGKDIVENTEAMAEDRDITTKQYYIIIPYYTDEITSSGDFNKREINNMAFSELYTRAQSIVSGLTECEVRGRILNSQELVELLYVAYNREQYDNYDFESYMSKSSYNSLYSVSEDVLEKRIRALDEEIARKSLDKAIEAVEMATEERRLKLKAIQERQKNLKEYIKNRSKNIIDKESGVLGYEITKNAKKKIDEMYPEEENQVETTIEQPKKKRKLSDLTEEEKRRLIAIRKKKMMKARENNGKKLNESN